MMARCAAAIAAAATALACSSGGARQEPDPAIAIMGVTVVRPALGAQEPDRTVILEGGRIAAVGPAEATPAPAGARVIDGRGRWLIPGLVDAHVHFFQSGNPFTRPDVVDFTDVVPYPHEVARNKARLPATFRVWLASGVTSVVDAGGPMWNFEVRARAEAAHVLVHSISDRPVDDELLELALEREIILIPTMWVTAGYLAALSGRFEPSPEERRLADPEVLAALEEIPRPLSDLPPPEPSRAAMENLRLLWAAGVPIALGTDAGNIGTVHGPSIFREARLMVDAGLTPTQVLVAATANGARVLGMEEELGDVVPGRLADLVLLEADPYASVDNLARASLGRETLRAVRAPAPRRPVRRPSTE